MELRHIPVLLRSTRDGRPEKGSILSILEPKPGDTVLDATVGLGGHAQAFLLSIGSIGHLTALDTDQENLELARERLGAYRDQTTFIHANFRDLGSLSLPPFDIIFADLGVSSLHLDDPARGFSLREDVPLDLRLNRERGRTAAEMLADMTEQEMKVMLRDDGELRDAGHLAKAMYAATRRQELTSTGKLRSLVETCFGFKAPSLLPQVFQAVRIRVNDELGALDDFLRDAPAFLRPGGRMGVISFHSLEDRRVKQAFRRLTTPMKDDVTGAVAVQADFELLTPKAVTPTEAEVRENPRSRSAKFRAIRRRTS